MSGIIKAQLYNITNSIRLLIVTLLVIFEIILELVACYNSYDNFGLGIVEGSSVLSDSGYYVVLIIFAAFIIFFMVCMDMNDHTLYTELASGISRKKALFGRYISGSLVSLVFIFVCTYLPVIVFTIFGGFGDTMPISAFFVRMLLYFVFILRMCAEFILLAVVLKKFSLALTIYAIWFVFQEIFLYFIFDILHIKKFIADYFFSQTAAIKILSVESMQEYVSGQGIVDKTISIIPTGEVVMVLFMNIILGILCYTLARIIFMRRDFT